MRECLNCGRQVTARFARVFGNNDNEVHGCPDCREFHDLCNGAAGGSTESLND